MGGNIMRALKITLRPSRQVMLPIAYNRLLHGLLYDCWKEKYPWLHDAGWPIQDQNEERAFKPFTFSPLSGRCKPNVKEKALQVNGAVSFEVRSPKEELIGELARQLYSRETVHLGAHEFEVTNLQMCDRILFPHRAIIRLASPVVEYVTSDGHTQPFCPTDAEWISLINKNSAWKAACMSIEGSPELTIIPKTETLKKRVTSFGKIWITGWTGDLIVQGDPSILAMLYYLGLGAKNSQGFGMFSILDDAV